MHWKIARLGNRHRQGRLDATPAADDDGGAVEEAFEYLHRDPGSVEAVTDESGSELVVLGHDPYGGRRKADWTAQLGASATETLLGEHGRRVSRGFRAGFKKRDSQTAKLPATLSTMLQETR